MSVRAPSLEEWFLAHQLARVRRDHFHLPFTLDADVSRLCARYRDLGRRVPVTAVLIQAAGLLAACAPEANRVVFQTAWGMRIVEPERIAVNVPVTLTAGSGEHLSAVVVREPHLKSAAAVRGELSTARDRPIDELPVGRYVFGQPNTLLRRLRLRCLHAAVQNLPQLYDRVGGGGVSVSSLMSEGSPTFPLAMMAYGATALTFSACHLGGPEGRETLKLGIGFDHAALPGALGVRLARKYAALLAAHDDDTLLRLADGGGP